MNIEAGKLLMRAVGIPLAFTGGVAMESVVNTPKVEAGGCSDGKYISTSPYLTEALRAENEALCVRLYSDQRGSAVVEPPIPSKTSEKGRTLLEACTDIPRMMETNLMPAACVELAGWSAITVAAGVLVISAPIMWIRESRGRKKWLASLDPESRRLMGE